MLSRQIQNSGVTAAAASGAIAESQNYLIDAAVREVELLEAPRPTRAQLAAAAASWRKLAARASARADALAAQ